MDTAIAAIKQAGATTFDVNITELESKTTNDSEFTVLLFDFKQDVAAYLKSRSGGPKTLQDLIDFNNANAREELKFFGQEIFILAQATTDFNDPKYTAALAESQGKSRHALDTFFQQDSGGHKLYAIIG